eukprot:TRINITY_DN14567_c0_g1_i5.p1 TRINITY_DN14567_c0_g1~~TRINITY_DN14567_c0_g1_i5.p1  ORF type:complete len:256 (-),score=44.36 TRINITY_DN14567_c0_g1_i5:366-1133(-)
MLRSLVGSEMCIRDRYQRRVRGPDRKWGCADLGGTSEYFRLGDTGPDTLVKRKDFGYIASLPVLPSIRLGRESNHVLWELLVIEKKGLSEVWVVPVLFAKMGISLAKSRLMIILEQDLSWDLDISVCDASSWEEAGVLKDGECVEDLPGWLRSRSSESIGLVAGLSCSAHGLTNTCKSNPRHAFLGSGDEAHPTLKHNDIVLAEAWISDNSGTVSVSVSLLAGGNRRELVSAEAGADVPEHISASGWHSGANDLA